MVGHLKFCLTLIGGYFIFSEHMSTLQLCGVATAFSGKKQIVFIVSFFIWSYMYFPIVRYNGSNHMFFFMSWYRYNAQPLKSSCTTFPKITIYVVRVSFLFVTYLLLSYFQNHAHVFSDKSHYVANPSQGFAAQWFQALSPSLDKHQDLLVFLSRKNGAIKM